MKLLFWILFLAVFYTYLGYGIVLFFLTLFKKKKKQSSVDYDSYEWPEICLFIAAYNERDILQEKIDNCFTLDYPEDKLKIVFVTDGSDDGSPEYLRLFPRISVLHEDKRNGKINAMNRGMKSISSPIVVFTDANTYLNKQAIKLIAAGFSDSHVGCIAGRKKVINTEKSFASETGEGLYWKYESWLKEKDAEFNSAVGAVGELFAIRTFLFDPIEEDTVLDDFIISFDILDKGFKLKYVPEAIASETASLNVSEELKRKVRIAAGGIQTVSRLSRFLNPFHYGKLAFQFFSHKVLRWTIAPWCLFLLYPLNLMIIIAEPDQSLFTVIFILQSLFYLTAVLGWLFEKFHIRFKIFFIPYYFAAINLATISGQYRYLTGKQSSAWVKAKRL